MSKHSTYIHILCLDSVAAVVMVMIPNSDQMTQMFYIPCVWDDIQFKLNILLTLEI